jgi:hypothetical protein
MRKRGYGSLIWGGLLIALGLVLLVENFDLLGDWNAPVWSLILGTIGLVFLATFASDQRQWWALIPGVVILGIAMAVFLAEQELIEGYVVASIILAGVGLPFLLIFITDRQHWWALIPALTMIGIAVAVFLEGINVIGGEAVGGIIVGGISLGFLSIYLIDRKQWWALFPGGVLGIVAFFLLLATVAEYVWPAMLILLGLLLLRGSLGGGRRPSRRVSRPSAPTPPLRAEPQDKAPVEPAKPERRRLPTLEEQIEAAITELPEVAAEAKGVSEPESKDEKPEPPLDMPPAPEMPEPPEVPSPPEIE